MRKSSIFKILKYLISFSIAIGILIYLFKDEDIYLLFEQAKHANYNWIIISIILALLSHWLRAYRWKLIIQPMGYNPQTFKVFLSVMIGYAANMVLPRLGEVVKCGALNKLEDIPVSKSIGTVLIERIIDLLFLAIIIFFTFFIEFQRLKNFIFDLLGKKYMQLSSSFHLGYWLFGLLIVVTIILIWLFRRFNNAVKYPLVIKIKKFLMEMKEGVTSIRKLRKQWAFWSSSLGIWIFYYLMSYIVVFSIPATSNLDPIAGLSILAMGSIGMTAPVQGGIGAYHFMISNVLILYHVNYSDGKLFATLLHTSQSFAVIVVGVASFLISSFLQKSKKTPPVSLEEN